MCKGYYYVIYNFKKTLTCVIVVCIVVINIIVSLNLHILIMFTDIQLCTSWMRLFKQMYMKFSNSLTWKWKTELKIIFGIADMKCDFFYLIYVLDLYKIIYLSWGYHWNIWQDTFIYKLWMLCAQTEWYLLSKYLCVKYEHGVI